MQGHPLKPFETSKIASTHVSTHSHTASILGITKKQQTFVNYFTFLLVFITSDGVRVLSPFVAKCFALILQSPRQLRNCVLIEVSIISLPTRFISLRLRLWPNTMKSFYVACLWRLRFSIFVSLPHSFEVIIFSFIFIILHCDLIKRLWLNLVDFCFIGPRVVAWWALYKWWLFHRF